MVLKVVLVFTLILSAVSAAEAKMVFYYDEAGQVHYVNPDLMPIPPQYMDQVRPQLEAPKRGRQENPQGESGERDFQYGHLSADAQRFFDDLALSKEVIVFYRENDAPYRRLIALLSASGLPYHQINVEDDEGVGMYRDFFTDYELPLVLIHGDTIVDGRRWAAVKTILENKGLIKKKDSSEDAVPEPGRL